MVEVVVGSVVVVVGSVVVVVDDVVVVVGSVEVVVVVDDVVVTEVEVVVVVLVELLLELSALTEQQKIREKSIHAEIIRTPLWKIFMALDTLHLNPLEFWQ